MPLRPPYKVFPILLKTHRHTIFLEAPATKTVESLKEDALSAMTAKVNGANDEDIPEILSVNDFEICREIKEKRRRTGNYVTLEGSEIVQKVAVAWETLYIRFKDSNGELKPVDATLPPISPDDDELPPVPSIPSKGKQREFL